MLANPMVFAKAGGSLDLVKINSDNYSSEYLVKETASETRIKIRHSKTKATATAPSKDRHNVEVVQTIYATESAAEFTRKVYIVVEHKADDSDIENVDALCDWLIASSNANLIALYGWQS